MGPTSPSSGDDLRRAFDLAGAKFLALHGPDQGPHGFVTVPRLVGTASSAGRCPSASDVPIRCVEPVVTGPRRVSAASMLLIRRYGPPTRPPARCNSRPAHRADHPEPERAGRDGHPVTACRTSPVIPAVRRRGLPGDVASRSRGAPLGGSGRSRRAPVDQGRRRRHGRGPVAGLVADRR